MVPPVCKSQLGELVGGVDSRWVGFHKKDALSHSVSLGMGQSWEGRPLQGQPVTGVMEPSALGVWGSREGSGWNVNELSEPDKPS